MAKKFGLGAGLEALMGGSPKEESAVIESATSTKEKKSDSKSNISLPAGIEQDENGKLWVDPEL